MSSINFKVLSVEKAFKNGFVVCNVKFNNSPKVYNFVRANHGGYAIVDGCKISFDASYNVTNIESIYPTKGDYKKDTSNTSKSIVTKIKEQIENEEIKVQEVQVVEPAKIPQVVKDFEGEIKHEKYEQIKTCLEAGIPVYLAGPAGSGKNHTVEQIAKDLNWNFYFSNSIQQEFKLTGFIDAGGNYHETEFYKALHNDGDCIFFLDEMDASIPEVLVLLNAAIANGYFEFPTGRVDFAHVHFVAAGNTVGSGADEMYTGRMVIDQATLDRFAIIEFDYSDRIEYHITKGNAELVNFVHDLRRQAKEKGIRATFSYRCLTMITKLERAGMDINVAIKITVFKGMDKDTINTFSNNGSTKYHKALAAIKQGLVK